MRDQVSAIEGPRLYGSELGGCRAWPGRRQQKTRRLRFRSRPKRLSGDAGSPFRASASVRTRPEPAYESGRRSIRLTNPAARLPRHRGKVTLSFPCLRTYAHISGDLLDFPETWADSQVLTGFLRTQKPTYSVFPQVARRPRIWMFSAAKRGCETMRGSTRCMQA